MEAFFQGVIEELDRRIARVCTFSYFEADLDRHHLDYIEHVFNVDCHAELALFVADHGSLRALPLSEPEVGPECDSNDEGVLDLLRELHAARERMRAALLLVSG